MLLWLGRSVDLKSSERNTTVVDLLSFDSEKELIADGVGKVPLLVGADATVVRTKAAGGTMPASECRSRYLLQMR
ncbi:hypothetical protein B296_00008788 [Ensete ventricosum]|uniref:Uncharacterized protein n=1 Tax=Ensete ventricosum TaxID=4639 RepID=A0A426XTU1_ENSVE|nr:hypothetical protein B296_00008788 [Ensete ventricosum]